MAFLFIVFSGFLLIQALRLMSVGWGAMNEPIRKPTPIHPELSEVKEGDELLVVDFTRDPLHASLQNRIHNGMEIEDPWDEDDDDDDRDGDVPAIVRR